MKITKFWKNVVSLVLIIVFLLNGMLCFSYAAEINDSESSNELNTLDEEDSETIMYESEDTETPQETEKLLYEAESFDTESSSANSKENISLMANNNSGDCYISALKVKTSKDGTAPFDDNDEAGNDSSSDNGIVRSFDDISYTLEYTTALRTEDNMNIEKAYVMVRFVLPCDPKTAVFDESTMNWCQNKSITYIYEDGTESNKWTKNKIVAKQVLTGKRLLVNNDSGHAIPGAGTLSAGIHVKAAENGRIIEPEFTLWMENNSADEEVSISQSVIVSAAPKYNVTVLRNSSANILAYYNQDTGNASSIRSNEADMYGRLQGYGVALSIRNDNISKGIRGIELPKGDITFDLRMSESVNGQDTSNSEDYFPFFWDYRMNTNAGTTTKGILGRLVSPIQQSVAGCTSWQTNLPYSELPQAFGKPRRTVASLDWTRRVTL